MNFWLEAVQVWPTGVERERPARDVRQRNNVRSKARTTQVRRVAVRFTFFH